MANTFSNMIRNAVSKQRIRYTENGFNLDLAYIRKNIIAMGYPADHLEGIYRNRIEDVYQFFENHHKDHYKIYNLCSERNYDKNKFHGRVAEYRFDDHNPPTIELIQKFCDDVYHWLDDDELNVAAVHCKAGKGRTGTMICCYLLHSGFRTTADDALAFYDEKRTKDKKGVTIPSQRRYVQYYSKLLRSGKPYERRTLQLCEIKLLPSLQIHSQGTVHISVSSLPDPSSAESVQPCHTSTIDFRKSQSVEFNDSTLITGDVKIEVYHKVMRKKEKYFHFWFNTYFVCDEAECRVEGDDMKFVCEFLKHELDDAHKDKEHKNFPEDFKVQVVVKPVVRTHLSGNETSRNNHYVLHNPVQNQNNKNNDQHNNQLPNHLLKNTTNTKSGNKGPIFETGVGGNLSTPKILSENNKIQSQIQHTHHQNIENKWKQKQQHSQLQIQSQPQQQQQQQQQQQHHCKNHNHPRAYCDVMLPVSIKDQQCLTAPQYLHHENSSNVHNQHQQYQHQQIQQHNHHHQQQQPLQHQQSQQQQHTPSVSPDVSRTNSSSSSSISSEASSAAGEDWESAVVNVVGKPGSNFGTIFQIKSQIGQSLWRQKLNDKYKKMPVALLRTNCLNFSGRFFKKGFS